MVLDFITKSKVRVTITKHIQIIVDTSPTDIDGLVENPAAKHLFQVREDGKDLSSQQQYVYRTLVEKILFMSCYLRPDLKIAIAFLTRRVMQPNIYEYKNLDRCVS